MLYVAVIFTFLVCLGPIIFFILTLYRGKGRTMSFFAGCICFLIFQVFTRIPLLSLLSAKSTDYAVFTALNPLLNAFFLSMSAGVFEESGRYIIFGVMKKRETEADPISFGLGHAGTEALILVALPLIQTLAGGMTVTPFNIFCSGVERISAITLHVSLSILIYRSVQAKKPIFLLLSIAVHTLFNVVATFLSALGVNIGIIEILLLIFAAASYFCINKFFVLKTKEC